MTPADVLTSSLSTTAKVLYGILLRYAGRDGECFPGNAALARDLGRSVGTVQRALDELEASGLLRRNFDPVEFERTGRLCGRRIALRHQAKGGREGLIEQGGGISRQRDGDIAPAPWGDIAPARHELDELENETQPTSSSLTTAHDDDGFASHRGNPGGGNPEGKTGGQEAPREVPTPKADPGSSESPPAPGFAPTRRAEDGPGDSPSGPLPLQASPGGPGSPAAPAEPAAVEGPPAPHAEAAPIPETLSGLLNDLVGHPEYAGRAAELIAEKLRDHDPISRQTFGHYLRAVARRVEPVDRLIYAWREAIHGLGNRKIKAPGAVFVSAWKKWEPGLEPLPDPRWQRSASPAEPRGPACHQRSGPELAPRKTRQLTPQESQELEEKRKAIHEEYRLKFEAEAKAQKRKVALAKVEAAREKLAKFTTKLAEMRSEIGSITARLASPDILPEEARWLTNQLRSHESLLPQFELWIASERTTIEKLMPELDPEEPSGATESAAPSEGSADAA